ncbi:MAG: restriction endonuclease subunit S, partial [Methanoregula sp.]|nr:restriction endonuclease subunit S [Methanoregula sp.]
MKNPAPENPAFTDKHIFEHFATLATAPDGIARLRALILQLAVQGKLGTQDPGDKPASVLLKKIQKEKEQLIKKREISKSRVLPKIESEEIPFQVPKNWIWLRLEDIGYNCGQKVPDTSFTYIDVTAINKEKGLIGDDVKLLQPNEAPSRARKLVKNGTVIYSTVRPYLLNIAIVDKNFNPEPIVSTAFAVVHPFEGISNRYLFYYLRSKFFVEYVESQMTGMAYPAINDQKFHMGLIPIPPTPEQHRIVAKVDRLMALCDELEARQQQERAGCLKLGTASLAGLQNAESPEEFGRQWAQVCDSFDLILDCPENVAVLRQMILQLAVQGRLVRQEPRDEPAGKLVERIKSEKSKLIKTGIIKKVKEIKPVEKSEELFSPPNGWVWVKLYDLIVWGIRNGFSPLPSALTTNTKVLTLSATTRGIFDDRYFKYLNEQIALDSHLWLNNGDILIQRSNSPEYVGISAIYHGDSNLFIYPDMMMKFRLTDQVDSDFIQRVIKIGRAH